MLVVCSVLISALLKPGKGKHYSVRGLSLSALLPWGECFKPKTPSHTWHSACHTCQPPSGEIGRPRPCTPGSLLCFPAFIYDLYVTSLVARSSRASRHTDGTELDVPSFAASAQVRILPPRRMRGPSLAGQTNAVSARCRCWRLPTHPTNRRLPPGARFLKEKKPGSTHSSPPRPRYGCDARRGAALIPFVRTEGAFLRFLYAPPATASRGTVTRFQVTITASAFIA
jgi:hypothetical protein